MAKGGQAQGQNYGVNPMNNSAQGMSEAFNTQSQAMAGSNNYFGGNNGQPQAAQYSATNQAGPQTIQSGMGGYQNQYDNDVIDTTTNLMNQNLAMQQDMTGAQASNAGAFGGARHGLVEATNASQTNEAIGRMSAQQRSQGFRDAANMSGQDISNQMNVGSQNANAMNQAGQFNANSQNQIGQFNANRGDSNAQQQFNNASQGSQNMSSMANQSYNIGNNINSNQMQAGGMAQQLNQVLMNNGGNMFSQYANQPNAMLQQRLQALGQNPMNNSGTQTSTQSVDPGWGATLGNTIGAAGNAFSFNPISFGS